MSETTEAAQEAVETAVEGATEAAQATEPQTQQQAPEQQEAAPETKEETHRPAWWQKRIDELTRARHEAERKAAQLEREIAARQPAEQQQSAQPPHNLTDAQIEERANAIAAQREYKRAVESTISRGEEKFGHAAFLASCNTLASLGANEQPAFMQAVTHMEHGAEVLHHLGSNPELAARMMSMDALTLVREMTKLEARITAPPPPKAVSRAPAPISPVSVGHDVDENAEPDADTEPAKWSQWVAKRTARTR